MAKKDLYKILLFLVIPIPLLYAGNFVIDKGLQKSKNPYFDVWNDIRKGVDAT